MKSGTTSLHEYLNEHPQIAMSTEKEPGYFVEELSLDKDNSWYQSLFENTTNELYFGESSTHYAKYPTYDGVAERIKNYNPEARLIYIMRDPFERMKSHYWHEVRAAHSGGEIHDIKTAIKLRSDYLDFSNYALQLEQYYKHFPKEQIHVITFEELVKQPNKVTKEIYEWLQISAETDHSLEGQAFNSQPEQLQGAAGLGILNKIQYSKTWEKISPFIPKTFKDTANKKAYKKIDKDKQNSQFKQLATELTPLFTNQTLKLKELTGRSFPEWPNYN